MNTNRIKYKKAVNKFMLSTYQVRSAWTDHFKTGDRGNNAHALMCLKKLQSNHNLLYVSDVEFKHIDGFISSLIGTMTNSTINKYIVHFRRFFKYCVNWGMIETNYANRIDKLKEERKIPYSFTDDDLKQIFAHSEKYRNFFEFMLETGLRPTDAWELKQSNFTVDNEGMCMKVWMHKPKKNVVVPISDLAKEIVESSGDKLFPWAFKKSARREPLKYLKQSFGSRGVGTRFCRKKGITLHSFRHTHAMNMLKCGVPKDVVQQFLGHSSVKTTEIYAREIPKGILRQFISR